MTRHDAMTRYTDKNNLECRVGGGGEAANLLYLGYNIITSPQRSTGHTLLVTVDKVKLIGTQLSFCRYENE